MNTGSEGPSDGTYSESRRRTPSRRIIAVLLICLAIAGVAAGSVWVYMQYFQPVQDTSTENQDEDSDPALVIPEQTPDNIIEGKTNEYLANKDIDGLKTYYQDLVTSTPDSSKQADLNLRLAQAIFIAYPDEYKADILTAAYRAEELAPTATTADFISVTESYYGNKVAAQKYSDLYIDRLGDLPEGE